MRIVPSSIRRLVAPGILGAIALAIPDGRAQAAETGAARATVVEMEGTVQLSRARATEWLPARTNDALATLDRIRTRERSRAALRLIDRSLFRLGERSTITVEPSSDSRSPASVGLLEGLLMFFHRGEPRDVQIRTRLVSAAIRGTEFQIAVAPNGRTVLTLFDGEVELSNPQGVLRLVSGEQATVDPGQPPVKTPLLVPKNDLIQWCLYYPGVLDASELNLTAGENAALQTSLSAYRSGDLLQALALIPAGYQPTSDAARVYLAAVLLSVGKVDEALPLIDSIPPEAAVPAVAPAPGVAGRRDLPSASQLAGALRRLILVVKNAPVLPPIEPAGAAQNSSSATVRLAESYQHQAGADLRAALAAAREATSISPEFAFAWARIAELEFSFGRRREAQAALARALELGPRNAEAVALRGFLFSAEGRIDAAVEAFNAAISLDGALGNAWLGRGLARIHRGELDAGLEDLQVAALLEPQRAVFRSYLGKAWQELGEQRQAGSELRLAKANDPHDPTAYLYEALLLQEENRINEAITSLERSQELNDNRRLYRSRLLLDQDQAVRGANLATIYRDAGMTDWSAREAGKAASEDYANWSAHLFLANSYNALRDAGSVNLRYETPTLSEYLVANLLAPAGAGTLSSRVSQQEYSKLFERNRLGTTIATEYLSRGALSVSGVQYGVLDNQSYAVEGGYLRDNGEHPNGEVEQWAMSLQLKQQISPSDGLYFQVTRSKTSGGDLNQYVDPAAANRTLSFHDEQEPLLLAGYHHEWSPGSHTLALVSRLDDRFAVDDGLGQSRDYFVSNGVPLQIFPQTYDQRYRSWFEIYSGELQQIWQSDRHSLAVGGRAQAGEFTTQNRHIPVDGNADLFWGQFAGVTNIHQQFDTPFQRFTLYGYDTWRVVESFQLVGGLAYDMVTYPRNYRYAPIEGGTATADGFLPKAGFIWDVTRSSALRFAFTRSLAGASFDQSFRLEPTQVAGFNQAFRSVIPETLVGANAGAAFDVFNLAWEQRLCSRTYLGLTLERLESAFNRRMGGYSHTNFTTLPEFGALRERLDYAETSVRATVDQLLGDEWVLGVTYRWSRAELENEWRDAAAQVGVGFDPYSGEVIYVPKRISRDGDLHELRLRLLYNHPCGVFAATEGVWLGQEAATGRIDLGSSSFWQWNATVGWRSSRRRLEVSVGLLNILGDWQGLQPINLHVDPPHERTFAASVRLNF